MYSVGQNWLIRVRFYANANDVKYQATVYADNGETEFTDSSEVENVFGDGYRSTGLNPLAFDLFEQRYVQGYYEMSRH